MSAGPTTFFSNHARTLDTEDEIVLTSVGVDIGSSTSHLVFSKIVMDRRDDRYVVTSREVLYESDVILTPYKDDTTIDASRLQPYFEAQYEKAGIHFDDVDAGALILTGVAVRRRNARAIADLFADQAGKFVAVSAGDSLETALVAYGSGAVALSTREPVAVMNVDIGGGTSKIALCVDGEIVDRAAIDVGARLICFDPQGRVTTTEAAGRKFAAEVGVTLQPGEPLADADREAIVDRMVERLFQAMGAANFEEATRDYLLVGPLSDTRRPGLLSFSGGVSEYIYDVQRGDFGDLGPLLASRIRERARQWGPELRSPLQGIRATVIGASQYTVQVSGSTIFVMPDDALPLRNIAVITPDLRLEQERLDPDSIAAAIKVALRRLDLQDGGQPVALYYRWGGSATYRRLEDFCRGITAGLEAELAAGAPLILVADSDVGGLVGLHCHESIALENPVVSVDGIVVNEFDFIDVGSILDSSGSVPVVIKSLVFPAATSGSP